MATLTPTLTLASTDALSDAISFSVTDSLSALGDVKRISYSLTTSPQDILSGTYNKSYVYMKNLSTTASEVINIGKKSTDTASTISGDARISISSTANVSFGMTVIGSGIQSASTITSVADGTVFTLNKTATASASGVAIIIGTEKFITLGAEEFAFFPWSGTDNLDAVATSGTPTLEIMIFEATA
tara:strand:+ start:399 stop:956 length:558 start_codon:yes stop_codon:yes gene_type:complete